MTAVAALAGRHPGDTHAFAEFVEAHKAQVFRWALMFAADADEAEDVMQETFVRLYQNLGQLRDGRAVEAWMYRVARRIAGKQRRTRKRRAELMASPEAGVSREVYLTDPGARVDRERSVQLIRDSVGLLAPRQREIFVLCDIDGRSAAEVAELLDMKAVTVRANLFKARTAIRERILREHPAWKETTP